MKYNFKEMKESNIKIKTYHHERDLAKSTIVVITIAKNSGMITSTQQYTGKLIIFEQPRKALLHFLQVGIQHVKHASPRTSASLTKIYFTNCQFIN